MCSIQTTVLMNEHAEGDVGAIEKQLLSNKLKIN